MRKRAGSSPVGRTTNTARFYLLNRAVLFLLFAIFIGILTGLSNGIIFKTGLNNGGYGNLVKIDHGNGVETWYGHTSKMLVKEGQEVKAGDIITVRENKKDNSTLKINIEENSARPVPAWLERDNEKISGKVVRLSAREDIDLPVEEHLIVELYSK